MKHYSKDYSLATCTNCFEDKLVRFYHISGMVDRVAKEKSFDDSFEYALNENKHIRFDHDEWLKTIWYICDYIINNIDKGIKSEDFIETLSYSKISINKLDFYTAQITLKVSKSNKSNTLNIILDTYDKWFMSKLISFVSRTLTKELYENL